MPFVTGARTPNAAPALSRQAARAALASADAAARRRAALALSGDRQAETPLLERLGVEADPNVRAALFASLAAIPGAGIPSAIAAFLDHGDPGLRGAASDALRQLQARAAPAIDALLGHPDPDLRLLAVEITRAWPPALAGPRLRRVIEADPHVNVCAAAVDIAAESGGAELLGPLRALGQRFPHHAFILFAAELARKSIADAGPGAA